MLHNVKIVPLDKLGHAEVYVDDHKMDGVAAVHTTHDVDSVPLVTIVLNPLSAEVEAYADVGLQMDIDSVGDAISCIQFALRLDDDFRNGILYGIADVLNSRGINNTDLTEEIMNRIFGLD